MLEKVISGGQTGADQAGLAAAKFCDIITGGFAPDGFRTLNGPEPKLKDYGLIEFGFGYKERTWKNVEFADATLRFASIWSSPGEKCTINAIRKFQKPHCDITIPIRAEELEDKVNMVAAWITENNFKVINIAGNSESTSPAIYKQVSKFLVKVFNKLKG